MGINKVLTVEGMPALIIGHLISTAGQKTRIFKVIDKLTSQVQSETSMFHKSGEETVHF